MKLIIPLLAFLIIPVSLAYGNEITYATPVPTWYSYDCSDPTPSVFTKADPGVSKFKYFSYFSKGKCYVILLNYDLSGLSNISNATNMTLTLDSKGSLINNSTLSSQYNVSCDLYYFDHPDLNAGSILQTPQVFNSFSCTGNATNPVISNLIIFDSGQINTVQNSILAQNYTLSLMPFPNFNATMQSDLTSSGYDFGIQKYKNDFYVLGDGFNCALISGSGMCNFLETPWKAIAIAFGADWIGPWFYVLIFFPFPMATYLITRNGTYAGFVGLGIMLTIQSINPMIFQIALTMILISASFGFYEIIKKRLLE